jgi:protein-S-isoprenylcysteine O-methyltransferase Ste14
MYLALTVLYIGIATSVNALWAMVLLPVALVALSLGVINREERYLERKFGQEYLRYKARVRRWL